VLRFDLWRGSRKKAKTVKKSQKCYISCLWGELPAYPICPKIYVWNYVQDITTCAIFQNEILRGCDCTGGRNLDLIFLLIFEWPLQQCSATVLPVIGLLLPLPRCHCLTLLAVLLERGHETEWPRVMKEIERIFGGELCQPHLDQVYMPMRQ